MGFLDRLFGRKEEPRTQPAAPTPRDSGDGRWQPPDVDEQALQRYRYMLKTAPPETIEQAHQEAFAKLTPDQRARMLRELASETPEAERAALAEGRDDPKSLARLATRTEMRRPGAMESIFGGRGMGTGMGGTIFGSLVGSFVGSMVAQQFLGSVGDVGFGEDDSGAQPEDEQTDDSVGDDSGYEATDDPGGYTDDSGGDPGSDWSGGDWGGGDFGGGDW